MTQKIIYTGDDFPEIDFCDEAIAWFNERRLDVYNMKLNAAEYCFNQTKEHFSGYYPSVSSRYKLYPMSGPCHSIFSKASDKSTSFIVNLFTRNVHQKEDRQFLEYILSPTESPWRSVLQDLYVIRDKDNDSYPIGYIFDDLNKHDIRVVTNFIIAGRLVSAWTQGVIFDHLLKQGFTKAEALVIGPNFYCAPNCIPGDYTNADIFAHVGKLDKVDTWKNRFYYSYSNRGYVSGDMPFNIFIDPWKVINGLPVIKEKKTLLSGGAPNPCNYIWDKSPKPDTPSFHTDDLLGFNEGKFKDISRITVDVIKAELNTENYQGQIILE